MSEANDLNDWFNCAADWCKRMKFRTASFCTERSGHFDAFDQGISFFLPNGTWLQPPGYVHKMIKDTWQPNAVRVTLSPDMRPGWNSNYSVSAQRSDDGQILVVRFT